MESAEGTIHGTLQDESCGKKTTVLVHLELKDELRRSAWRRWALSRIVPTQICLSECCQVTGN